MYKCIYIFGFIANQDIYVRKIVVVIDNTCDFNGINIIYNH